MPVIIPATNKIIEVPPGVELSAASVANYRQIKGKMPVSGGW
jgi:hypothetical protein